ncbi:DEAD/DEAH box helicase family protein [Verrucomicrobia bacterium]|nr:DEAD/DEAH box helicase family protein [Verrucomicrobiota bacterium]
MSQTLIKSCKDWSDFQTRLSALTNKRKGDAFEDLVALSFQITPKDKTKYKNIWKVRPTKNASYRIPEKLRNKLRLPEPDLGIDLLAETFEGEYHAIQCKYHSNVEDSVTKAETDSGMSLAFSQCKGISCFILATSGGSAGKRSRHLKDYATGKLAIRDIETWQDLGEVFFKAAKALIDKRKPPTAKPFTPRAHQKRAIKNALNHFVTEKNSRGKMIMPCGSGKSLTGYWIAQDIQAKRIVVAVPSLALVKQTIEVWAEQAVLNKKTVNWICVCSDKSIEKSDDDDPIQFQDLGVKVDTDPAVIAKWLKKRTQGIKVIFTTYQSGKTLADAAKAAKVRFDFGVLDEAHKTVGNRDKAFAHLLYEENIRIKKRLSMTATERRYAGSGDDILSMDNESIYGETFELLSFKEALECEPPILCDYKILTIAIDEAELKEAFQKNILVKPDKGKPSPQEIRMVTAVLAARKAIRDLKVKHVISFHSSVARAINFKKTNDRITESMPTFGDLDTFHVSAQLNTGKRQKIIRDFADSKKSLITNARCLTEGVDIKQVDCVMFADRKKSAVDIVQATGRALRPFKGKKMGYVIIPILVSSKNTKKRIEESEEFQDVLMTLRALASNDDRIIEYFRTVSEGARVSKSKKIFEVLDAKTHQIETEKLESNLKLLAWNKLAKLSWRPFEEAREFVRTLGLKNEKEWREYKKLGKLPADIPKNPSNIYRNKGWISNGDWFGTGNIACYQKKWRPFKAARSFARNLKLKTSIEWRQYAKVGNLPSDIPTDPYSAYQNKGWINFSDWLGTKTIAAYLRKYRPFKKARVFARSLKLQKGKEWRTFTKSKNLPTDIPAAPQVVYKNTGWVSMGDWLGSGYIAASKRKYRSYEEALLYVHSLNLKTEQEWRDYAKTGELPIDIPVGPSRVYKNCGWKSVGDWLGTRRIATSRRKYLSFKKARETVHALKLKNGAEYKELAKSGKLPQDIPANPRDYYKESGWKGIGDWLGTYSIAPRNRKYRSIFSAKKYVHSLNLKTQVEWRNYAKSGKLPSDIPNWPPDPYKNKGWISWGDWLGNGTVAHGLREYRTFNAARVFARSLNLETVSEWLAFCKSGKLPADIPSSPNRTYKDKGWKGMRDWLGINADE